MIQRGDKVLYLEYNMPGVVVDVNSGQLQVEWKEGCDHPFSGRTLWGGEVLLDAGLAELVGENRDEPKPPAEMEKPIAHDLFERAIKMSLEL